VGDDTHGRRVGSAHRVGARTHRRLNRAGVASLGAWRRKREGDSVVSRQDSLVLLSPVTSGEDIRALQRVASACWPAGWHPGGLGWALARGELADEVVLLRDGDYTLGWAGRGAHDDGELLAQVRAGHDDGAELLVGWLLDCPVPRLHIDVYHGDSTWRPR
jgi:hypothetical protein